MWGRRRRRPAATWRPAAPVRRRWRPTPAPPARCRQRTSGGNCREQAALRAVQRGVDQAHGHGDRRRDGSGIARLQHREKHGREQQDARRAGHEDPLETDAVAQHAAQRHGEQRQRRAPDGGIQHGGARDAQRAGGVGQREGDHGVEPGHFGQPAADHDQHFARIAAQHHQRRHLDLVALFAHALEVGRFGDLARMNQPTSSSTTLARNGMRQPQDSMSSRAARRLRPWPARTGSGPAPRRSAAGCRRSPSCLRARRRPSGWRRPIRRRPPRPAGSASAPAARRPSSRCCRRRIRPIRMVGMPIMKSVMSSMDLRPTLSPKWPNTTRPAGGRRSRRNRWQRRPGCR